MGDAPDPLARPDVDLERFRGFHDPGKAAREWSKVRDRLPGDGPFVATFPEVLERLLSSADPDLGLAVLLRWIEGGLEGGDEEIEGRGERWERSERFRAGFLAVAGASPALGENILRFWSQFDPDAWQTGWASRQALAERLERLLEGSSGEGDFLERTRRFRILETLRIGYLEYVEELPVDQVTRQIATLADVIIERAFVEAREVVARKIGFVPPDGGFSVLALGKLGGRELNFSSDIDLNFVFDERVERLERLNGDPCTDPLEIERFFQRLAERLIHYISAFTRDGILYRLDARLRPEGSSGRLVWSVRASLDYYYTAGRNWERQALIRMRHVAGDAALSRRFLRELDEFIFPAVLSEANLAEMRELKLQVERIASDRGEEEREIKIGQGGIRDVEYIVQFLQLVHAHRAPSLKTGNIFDALEALERERILKPEETDALQLGYRFLRRVENRLQLAHMLQTHRLPEDPRELLRIARSLGFETAAAFRGRLARHAARIRRVFRLFFEQATRKQPAESTLLALIELPFDAAVEEGSGLLAAYGFENPQEAFKRIRSLAGPGRFAVDPSRTKDVFRKLLSPLLREISAHPQPDRTLSNFEDCVHGLGARTVFYQLLDESEPILQLFVDVCSRSNLVVEILRRRPGIFDEVVDCLLTGYSFDRKALIDRATALPRSEGDFEREIFEFKYTHLLLTAIRELEGNEKLRVTLQHVSEIAEAILHAVLLKSLDEAEKKLGRWKRAPPAWVVLGLGKLGGQEMTFQSDIDIVFVYEGRGETDRGLSSQEYFERLWHLILGACKVADFRGPLLEVDVRLRPLGSHNSLAISKTALEHYFREGPAETWERQAFMRARPIAGDDRLAREVMTFVHGSLVLGGDAGPPDAETICRDVWRMRRRLEEHAGSENLKRGRGGIMDIEFLVQAFQLLHGKRFPEILVPNTAAALERLERANLVSSSEVIELFNTYRFLRWLENRFSLVSDPGESLDHMDDDQLELTVQKIGYRSSGEETAREIFRAELDYHRRKSRGALLRALGNPGDG